MAEAEVVMKGVVVVVRVITEGAVVKEERKDTDRPAIQRINKYSQLIASIPIKLSLND